MSTIGHPLSDLVNITMPFVLAVGGPDPQKEFIPGQMAPGMPTKSQVIDWYAEVAGWDPHAELKWGEAFGMFRNACIMQGIAARYALRQASSAKAKDYGDKMEPFGRFCYGLIVDAQKEGGQKAKL